MCLPALDLEKWYQKVMAGFETSSSSVSPPSSPPPLPAKAHSSHKALQVILALCCQGSGFGATGCGKSGAVWGRSCGPCSLSAAGALAATAGRGRADLWLRVGSLCLLLGCIPLPGWHRHRAGSGEPSLQGDFCSSPMSLSCLCLCAQVYRAKTEGAAGVLTPRMKSGTPSSSQLNLSVLERSPSPKVWLPGGPRQPGHGSHVPGASPHPHPCS